MPTERGRLVTAFLEEYFAKWVAYGFTTHMEADLDRVAAGGADWTGVLEAFRGPFEAAVEAARELRREDIRDALETALERYLFAAAGEPVDRACPACADGALMLKLGRFGPFVSCANFPDCRHSRPLFGDPAEREEARRPVVLGTDAETGLALTLRRGRYGRYIQRGEDEGKTKALRRTVPASMEADEITPELARALLALPRIVGVHPETGKTIRAGIGRYGAWLKHGATYVPPTTRTCSPSASTAPSRWWMRGSGEAAPSHPAPTGTARGFVSGASRQTGAADRAAARSRHHTTAGYAHLAGTHRVEAADRVGSLIADAMTPRAGDDGRLGGGRFRVINNMKITGNSVIFARKMRCRHASVLRSGLWCGLEGRHVSKSVFRTRPRYPCTSGSAGRVLARQRRSRLQVPVVSHC